jgi:hypothetical protein
VPVPGIGAPPFDLCQQPKTRGVDDVGGSVELFEFLLEAVVVEPGGILGQDLLERRPERAHATHARERAFTAQ